MTEAIADRGTLRRRADARANLSLSLVAIALAFVALEIGARTLLPAPLPWLHPQLRYRSDPALVFALAPNQRAFTADQPVVINERGLRGPLVPYERQPDHMRVLFLGDSIVFGYGVADPDVVSARVVDLLGEQGIAAEAINAGVPSYNSEQELTYLAREGIRYRPDWVILGVCWNDLNEKAGVRVDESGFLTSAAARSVPGALRTGADEAARLGESPLGHAARNTLKRSRALYGSLEGWRALIGFLFPDEQTLLRSAVLDGETTPFVMRGWERVTAAIQGIRGLSVREGFRTLVVTFPIPLALERPFPESTYPRRVQEAAEREGVASLDLTASFRAAHHGHDSLFIPYDGDHPNAAGHAVAARAIARVLGERQEVPPS